MVRSTLSKERLSGGNLLHEEGLLLLDTCRQYARFRSITHSLLNHHRFLLRRGFEFLLGHFYGLFGLLAQLLAEIRIIPAFIVKVYSIADRGNGQGRCRSGEHRRQLHPQCGTDRSCCALHAPHLPGSRDTEGLAEAHAKVHGS